MEKPNITAQSAMRAAGGRPAKVSEVLELLGRRVVTGDYAVGETLPVEKELIEELSVSRTTLREAIKTLTALGMISPM